MFVCSLVLGGLNILEIKVDLSFIYFTAFSQVYLILYHMSAILLISIRYVHRIRAQEQRKLPFDT